MENKKIQKKQMPKSPKLSNDNSKSSTNYSIIQLPVNISTPTTSKGGKPKK